MSDTSRLLSSSPNIQSSITNSPADQPPHQPSLPNYGSIQSSSNNTSTDESDIMPEDKTTLKFLEKVGFSLGHVYNDLCAGIWFSYTLLFMQNVLGMKGPEAGAMVMLGQVKKNFKLIKKCDKIFS
jgi:hypothetical protein